MDVIIWLVVGLIAGLLASGVMGLGFGMLGDIALGVAGACIGGWIFHELGWPMPFEGHVGVVAVALVGAAVPLILLRVVQSAVLLRRGA